LWIVEHACGKWVALRCPDDDFIVYANGFQIETEWDLASTDLIDYAVRQGWYNPNTGAPFNFRKSYGRRLDDPYNVMREKQGRKLLEDKVGSITVKDVIMATRDHYEGTEFASYKIIDTHMHVQTYHYPPHKSPYRTICIPRTQCTMVCHLRDDWPREIGSLMWYSMSSPCVSVYLPIYAGSKRVPKDYLVGEGKYDPESAWWAFDMLQRLADKYYVDVRPYIRTVWNQFEEAEFEQIGRLETIARDIYQQDSNLATELISEYTYLQLNTAKNMAKALVHAILRDYDTENVDFETTSTTGMGPTAKHDLESP
jgi:dipeptidase